MKQDDYVSKIIRQGDSASSIMAELCAHTKSTRPEIDIIDPQMRGMTVLRLEPNKKIAIHSASGNPIIVNSTEYAASLVETLVNDSLSIGAEPIAMTNIIDMQEFDLSAVKQAAEGLYDSAKKRGIGVINGEVAGLGNRVTVPFNISGTMISYIDSSHANGVFCANGTHYIVLDYKGPDNKSIPVYANSDGVGTKIEVAERTGKDAVMQDAIAMLVDDSVRKAANVKALSFVLETNNKTDNKAGSESPAEHELRRYANVLAHNLDVYLTIQTEALESRISGYGHSPYNIGGTAISFIDEARLKNMPRPRAGDVLVAIRDKRNKHTFRSNGISKVRQGFESLAAKMAESKGTCYEGDWHNYELEGKTMGEWAGTPSTIFYKAAKKLFDKELITGFFHMSGGAYKGKLAEPLAKLGLSTTIMAQFEPSPAMKALVEHMNLSVETAYEIWNMGTEAYVTTQDTSEVSRILNKCEMESRIASTPLRQGKGLMIKAYDGTTVKYC